MKHEAKELSDRYAFGPLRLSRGEKEFYISLNRELFRVSQRLPSSLQGAAVMFLLEYGGKDPTKPFDFFRNYPPMLWCLVYWIARSTPGRCSAETLETATALHAMTLFLHSLDDHINDGQLRGSHLLLQLRTVAWNRLEELIEVLSRGDEGGSAFVAGLLETYFEGITHTGETETLDEYCRLFQRQSATVKIAPYLLASSVSGDSERAMAALRIQEYYSEACRLLDDLQDFSSDAREGAVTSVRLALSPGGRSLWDDCRGKREDDLKPLMERILSEGVLHTVALRMDRSLELAAREASRMGWSRLMMRFEESRKPLTERLMLDASEESYSTPESSFIYAEESLVAGAGGEL